MDATSPSKIILGSSSIARRKIFSEMGYEFTIMTADIDEKVIRKEKPEELVMALAEAKAETIIKKIPTGFHIKDAEPTILVTCDQGRREEDMEGGEVWWRPCWLSFPFVMTKTKKGAGWKLPVEVGGWFVLSLIQSLNDLEVVVYEGMVREKPSSKEEARQFIKGYSGGHAATVSSVLVTNLQTGLRIGEWDKVEIYFHDIPDEIIDNLMDEGIVLHVAGGLIIEHPLILPFVKEVVGTTDSVMGLPKALTQRLIKEAL